MVTLHPSLRPRASRPRSVFALLRDRRAVAAVEFALLLPLMITMFVGGNEISQALAIFRKVGHTSSTLGDLVAQEADGLVTSELTDMLAASSSVMTPYSATSAQIVVSSVKYTTSGGFKVCWSRSQNATAWTAGSAPPVTIPTGIVTDGQEVIVTNVSYTYTSVFSTVMTDILGSSSITLSDTSYFRPRVVTAVTYNGADCT